MNHFVTGMAVGTILFLTQACSIPLRTTFAPHQEDVTHQIYGHSLVEKTTGQKSQFRHIKQPLALKLAVTLGGLALIGLEVWWFLLSQTFTTDRNR